MVIPGRGNNIKQFWDVWNIQVDGQGMEEDELERRVQISLRWPCVPARDCPDPLATSCEPTLDAGAPV